MVYIGRKRSDDGDDTDGDREILFVCERERQIQRASEREPTDKQTEGENVSREREGGREKMEGDREREKKTDRPTYI